MLCSHCGRCCEETEMLLSRVDVKRLETLGYSREEFFYLDKKGSPRLRNRKGYCCFYDKAKHRCKVYKYRPLGCRIYPVVYSEEKGITVDDFCLMKNTISNSELKQKGKKLISLLKRIDDEAEKNAGSMPANPSRALLSQ